MKTPILKTAGLIVLVATNVAFAEDASGPSPRQVEDDRMARAEYRAGLDDTMQGEGRDVYWAAETEYQIEASLQSVSELDVMASEFACAVTLCRVVLDHRTLSGQQEVLEALAGMPGFSHPGRADLEWRDDGSATTYIYLQRQTPEEESGG
jgi:hypothetical protein